MAVRSQCLRKGQRKTGAQNTGHRTNEVSAIFKGYYKTISPKKCRQQKQIFQMLPFKLKRTKIIGYNTHTHTHNK